MIAKPIKPIRLTQHAKIQILYRGASEEEIINTIRTSKWSPSELGRLECRKNFEFNNTWNDKLYKTKQIRPIFAEEVKEIIVVTVYVYYF
jgi:hypothetical protein